MKTQVLGRYAFLDALRGLAIVLMVIFHIAYDMRVFNLNQIDFHQDKFWFLFPRLIVFLFLICVGMGQRLAHPRHINWPMAWQRFAKIFGLALLISLVTFIVFPKSWVYFGTLHCIATTSLTCLFFLYRPKVALGLGIALLGFNFILPQKLLPISDYFDISSMDYIPFYPWFGVVLLGIYAESKGLARVPLPDNHLVRFLCLLGRHSLGIYLLHQPLLFGALYLLTRLK